jgi:molybdopterin molybdotransferase
MPRATEALKLILDSVSPLPSCDLPLPASLGRVLACDVCAREDLPSFDNSAMDGYAVRASDVAAATPSSPVRLRVLEDVPAGSTATQPVVQGSAIRIMTGAAMPPAADCVVRVEDTSAEGELVFIARGVCQGFNVRAVGEDVKVGQVALAAGTCLRAAELGVLAALGCARVRVHPAAKVAVITTGDELVDADAPPGPGKIRDANSYTLSAQVRLAGAEPLLFPRVPDDKAAVESALQRALAGADLVLTNGGVSVGDYDYVKAVLESMGAKLGFWGVEQKPGKPLAAWLLDGKCVVSLPGYPASAMVCFEEYVRPALRKMMGHVWLHRPVRHAELTAPYFKKADRRLHLLRVWAWEQAGAWKARLSGAQGSGVLSSMAAANGLAAVAEDVEEARVVPVHMTDLPEDH